MVDEITFIESMKTGNHYAARKGRAGYDFRRRNGHRRFTRRTMQVIALIPARKGSKRIPGKNMALLAGKPLLQYTIEQAIEAAIFSDIVVSSDWGAWGGCLELAKKMGVTALDRPKIFSSDESPDFEWVSHAMRGRGEDAFMILRPTSPFRSRATIIKAWNCFQDTKCDSVRAICKTKHHPYKSWRMGIDGYLRPLNRGSFWHTPSYDLPTQSLEQIYCQAGSFHIAGSAVLQKYGNVSGDLILPYILEGKETIDINEPEDLAYAEWLMTRCEH